ncbi:hypothetical protein [Flavobacterium sp.]|uniref:hypothetical protein n=1 Tax=Flavobacterium sp. TaxID=239 RepID=UPI002B4AEDD3|nr:hypothetical protein [Flavobacterium sp.]HLP65558.1 hypothetical protein [Flavobacterium sp.]
MKNQIKRVIVLMVLLVFHYTNAQVLDGLVKSAEKKVAEKVNKELKKDNDNKQKKSKVIKKSSEFEPANTLVFLEDFSKDKIGAFPASMMTNSSGEIVEIDDQKWLQLGGSGAFTFKDINKGKPFSQEFTLEFELYASDDFVRHSKELGMVLAESKNIKKDFSLWGENRNGSNGIKVGFHPIEYGDKGKGQTRFFAYKGGLETQKVEKIQTNFSVENNKVKVQVKRTAERIMVFIDGVKIWDNQNAFDANKNYSALVFTTGEYKGENAFYISNIKYSEQREIEEPK